MSRQQRALLVSVGLHIVLLYGLVGLRFDAPDAVQVLQVSLIELGASESSDPLTAEAPASADAAFAASPSVERIESVPPLESPPTDALSPADEESRAAGPRAPAPRETAAPAPGDTPADAGAVAATARAAPSAVPATGSAVSARTSAVLAAAPKPVRIADIPALREPEPATVKLADAQRAMLRERADDWVRHAAELAADGEELRWREDGRDYSASFRFEPARDGMGMDEVVVAVATGIDGRRFAAELRLQRLAFSSFAQFVDRWDPAVRIHDDEIDGRFHSNTEIYVDRSGGVQPTFHGKVTTARSINTSTSERRIRRDEVFLGGLQTRVGRIALPRRSELAARIEAGPRRAHRLERDARITFVADGAYVWQYLEGMAAAERVDLPREAYYLIAGDEAELYVSGTVDGQVLVYSPKRITVEGDLVYAADPELDADSDDYLGLVSDKRVEIAEPEVTGPGDLHIQASIYAGGRFAVQRYRSRRSGTLRLFGSLTSGSLSATEPRYRTRLVFDRRLERLRPPGFPVSDRFEMIALDEHWTEVDYSDPLAGALGSCNAASRGAANTCVQ